MQDIPQHSCITVQNPCLSVGVTPDLLHFLDYFMPKYQVSGTIEIHICTEVEANNAEEAHEMVETMLDNDECQIDLTCESYPEPDESETPPTKWHICSHIVSGPYAIGVDAIIDE